MNKYMLHDAQVSMYRDEQAICCSIIRMWIQRIIQPIAKEDKVDQDQADSHGGCHHEMRVGVPHIEAVGQSFILQRMTAALEACHARGDDLRLLITT